MGVMVSTFHETQSFTYSSAIYKCNLHDRTPEWSRVRDIGDQTLFVSKHFNKKLQWNKCIQVQVEQNLHV